MKSFQFNSKKSSVGGLGLWSGLGRAGPHQVGRKPCSDAPAAVNRGSLCL